MDAGTPVSETAQVARVLGAHAWLVALVVCVLLGAGFRLVPNSTAAPASGAGSTACAAK